MNEQESERLLDGFYKAVGAAQAALNCPSITVTAVAFGPLGVSGFDVVAAAAESPDPGAASPYDLKIDEAAHAALLAYLHVRLEMLKHEAVQQLGPRFWDRLQSQIDDFVKQQVDEGRLPPKTKRPG